MSLTADQVTMLTDWVNGGGNLIAMRPDTKLASLLGLTDAASTLSDAYLLVNTASAPGQGIVGETIQFHGTADRLYAQWCLSRCNTLFQLPPQLPPILPLPCAVWARGQAAAFTYDLARSVVYTRQGNPAWSGQERDGNSPIRSNDLFYPDWIDLDKVAHPPGR